MFTDFTFVSIISGKSSKTGKDFNILHYVYKNQNGQLVTNQEFLSDPDLIKKVDGLVPMKTYSADVRYINGKNVLIDLQK